MLPIITKRSILDVAAALDPPLISAESFCCKAFVVSQSKVFILNTHPFKGFGKECAESMELY